MRFLVLFPVLIGGCGWSTERYVDEHVQAECAFLLDCQDPAVTTFLGWETVEDCIEDRGPELTALAQGCEYDSRSARACVKGFEELACPADGEELAIPAVCDQVFLGCGDAGADTDADTDTEE